MKERTTECNIQKWLLWYLGLQSLAHRGKPFPSARSRFSLSLVLSVFLPIVSMLNRSARDNSPYHMRSALCRALRSPPPSPKRAAPSVAGVLVARAMPSLASLTSRHLSLKRLGGVWASCGFALIDITLFFFFFIYIYFFSL